MAMVTIIPLLLTSPAQANPEQDSIAQAPKISVTLANNQKVADGLLFVAPKPAGISGATSSGPVGPEIVDNNGRPVWFLPITNGQSAADFRVQKYHNRPVLTWAQQKGFGGLAQDESADYIFDSSYHLVATVHAGNGLNADAHEFLISPEDTALITIYNAVPHDLSAVGGSKAGQLMEGAVQEIDIASGKVIFEWHSLDHVALEESYEPLPTSSTKPWDYFHLNAVSIDDDGNLLLSARHTSAVYKIDRRTGTVIWRLGGKRSDFNLGPDVRFSYQHNPVVAGKNVIRIFDNESNGKPVVPSSRVIWIKVDPSTRSAELVRSIQYPNGLSVASQGSAQALNNGDTLIGWGVTGRFSEFDPGGHAVFDAVTPSGDDTYRAYRFVWHGDPTTKPTATARRDVDGSTIVHAIWNGATDALSWDVLDASGEEGNRDGHDRERSNRDHNDRRRIASATWNGLDTIIPVSKWLTSVQVVAIDRAGREIGRSDVAAVSPYSPNITQKIASEHGQAQRTD